jgi:hypothetical protein
MSLAEVKYGKYAHLVPDVVTYEFYEYIININMTRYTQFYKKEELYISFLK